MARKVKFDKNAAFKNIIGQGSNDEAESEVSEDAESEAKTMTGTSAEVIKSEPQVNVVNFNQATREDVSSPTANLDAVTSSEQVSINTKKGRPKTTELRQLSLYITNSQYRAMKIRAALSESPEDKDLSAIMRTALDLYLAEDLKKL
jgi:hypothetical protein